MNREQTAHPRSQIWAFDISYRIITYCRICQCVGKAFVGLCSFSGLSDTLMFTKARKIHVPSVLKLQYIELCREDVSLSLTVK